jgi:hypothetical protein
MRALRQLLWSGLAAFALVALVSAPAQAQARLNRKYYVVSSERAVSVTRSVLVRRGYRVVRIERVGPNRVVYYRLGRGRGPVQRMVIRSVRDRVLFEETDPAVLIDVDVDLNR